MKIKGRGKTIWGIQNTVFCELQMKLIGKSVGNRE